MPALSHTDALILTMLTAGERHGYAIRQDITDYTEGDVRLEAGNLYRAIGRLLDDGLIEESARRPAATRDDERRRYYRLTPLGKRTLAADMMRMRSLVKLAESRKVIAPEHNG